MSGFTISFDLANDAGLAALNRFLEPRAFITGFTPCASDLVVFQAIGSAPDASKYPNVARYYKLIAGVSDKAKKGYAKQKPKPT